MSLFSEKQNFDLRFYFALLQDIAHTMAKEKGFYATEDNTLSLLRTEHLYRDDIVQAQFDEAKIARMHSELSEALEAYRTGNPPDDKLPQFDSATVEFADVIIRILDFAGRKNMPLMAAILAKMEYNASRPYKHGKKT
jgi:hypothetical protein